jgi:hypothetical protein
VSEEDIAYTSATPSEARPASSRTHTRREFRFFNAYGLTEFPISSSELDLSLEDHDGADIPAGEDTSELHGLYIIGQSLSILAVGWAGEVSAESDTQTKLRGLRIELQDTEQYLLDTAKGQVKMAVSRLVKIQPSSLHIRCYRLTPRPRTRRNSSDS